MVLILLTVLCLDIAIAIGASNKGRSGIGWFFFALFLSPLIAGVFLLVVRDLSKGSDNAALSVKFTNLKNCPRCAEQVQKAAQVCRFCGYEFQSSQVSPVGDAPLKRF